MSLKSSTHQALVSVVLPTYAESRAVLEMAISSILRQTYRCLELLIVVDNPLNPNQALLESVADGDPRVKLLVNERNLGLPGSLNRGILASKGEYVARMDADDVSDPQRIQKQVSYLEENPNIGLCGAFVNRIDSSGISCGAYTKPTKAKNLSRYARFASPVMHPTWVFRREVFDLVGGYQNISPAQDYLFLVTALKKKVTLGNLPERLLDYRESTSGLSGTNLARTLYVTNLIRGFARSDQKSIDLTEMLARKIKDEDQINSLLSLRAKFLKKRSLVNDVVAILISMRSRIVLDDMLNLVFAKMIIVCESKKFR